MSSLPIIPESAPFSPEQRSWLNGFLAGMLSRGTGAVPAGGAAASPAAPLLVLFGSQSGNAEALAKKVAKEAGTRGFSARAAAMDAVNATALANEPNVLLITSTWGEGEMPDNAAGFWDQLNQNGSSPKLNSVRYSVLALGDMNYADTFCFAGRKFDERLAELGATRIHPRQDCDVDFETPAKAWVSGALEALLAAPAVAAVAPVPTTAAVETAKGFSKKNPCPATLIENRLLNGQGSAKDTRHIAFAIPAEGMDYEAGDALGVFALNCPGVVDQVIAAHGLSGDAPVAMEDGKVLKLRDALISNFEVRSLLGVKPVAPVSPQDFIDGLRALQPRLYSISSSPKAHPGEVHLTVGAVRYEANGLAQKGVASTFLADRLAIGETANVFIQKSTHFRVPADPVKPMIMVGPGTGIAPFRAFLEEREAAGAKGRNWLFFGDQRHSTDFLYEQQITEWQLSGHLTRLDLAFSRDQKEKVYVQNRMIEHAAELWAWLEEGAHFYVCGDASRMAKDVDAALHEVIRTAGGKTEEEAAAWVAEMKKAKRYVRDVY